MDFPPWLDDWRRALARRGLPTAYRERLLEEWRDHVEDALQDEEGILMTPSHGSEATGGNHGQQHPATTAPSAGRSRSERLRQAAVERLGDPGEAAAFAARHHRGPAFAARRPALVFLATPLFAVLAAWVAVSCSLWLLANVLEHAGFVGYPPGTQYSAEALTGVHAVIRLLLNIPIVVLAWWYCRLGLRSGASLRWPTAACGLLAVLGALLMVQVGQSGEQAHLAVGLLPAVAWEQLLQALVPAGIAWWMLAPAARAPQAAAA